MKEKRPLDATKKRECNTSCPNTLNNVYSWNNEQLFQDSDQENEDDDDDDIPDDDSGKNLKNILDTGRSTWIT